MSLDRHSGTTSLPPHQSCLTVVEVTILANWRPVGRYQVGHDMTTKQCLGYPSHYRRSTLQNETLCRRPGSLSNKDGPFYAGTAGSLRHAGDVGRYHLRLCPAWGS